MNIIKNFSPECISLYSITSEPQLLHYYEPDLGIFIAESPKVIKRALNAGYEPLSMVVETRRIETELADIADKLGDIPVYTAEIGVLSELLGFKLTVGALCAMRRKKLPDISEVCSGAHRIAVLANVENPTNVGAIFRSASALFMDAVILTPMCADPLYRRSIRVSMGNVFNVPWTFLKSEELDELQNIGFKTVAMALTDNSVSIDSPLLAAEDKLAIVLGNEGDGLPQTTIDKCDYTVKIPMSNEVDSLNVAAASAIAFWELRNAPNQK